MDVGAEGCRGGRGGKAGDSEGEGVGDEGGELDKAVWKEDEEWEWEIRGPASRYQYGNAVAV